MTKKVIIASKNPVKIKAVKNGFERMFPENEYEFEGVSVPSGVSDQPMDDAETFQGAFNRTENAKDAFPSADFWVGIEGGIDFIGKEMTCFAWVLVQSKEKKGKAKTATFMLPEKVAEIVKAGKELGDADDIVFGQSNSKQKTGALGLLTKNVVSRIALYEDPVIMALIPFKNEELY